MRLIQFGRMGAEFVAETFTLYAGVRAPMSSKHYDWRLGEELPALGEHSLAKHDIFDQYVGIYVERLTRTWSQTMLNLTVIDGFCGGGLYRRGQAEADG